MYGISTYISTITITISYHTNQPHVGKYVYSKYNLVGVFNPSEKILIKSDRFPNFRDEHTKNLWVATT